MELPLLTVCRITGAPRSTVYHRRSRGTALGCRPGPKTEISDVELLERIRQVIAERPFAGGGHRKVRAHLRRKHGTLPSVGVQPDMSFPVRVDVSLPRTG